MDGLANICVDGENTWRVKRGIIVIRGGTRNGWMENGFFTQLNDKYLTWLYFNRKKNLQKIN